jgi:hypothetical protein
VSQQVTTHHQEAKSEFKKLSRQGKMGAIVMIIIFALLLYCIIVVGAINGN